MNTKLIIGASIVISTVFLLSFTNRGNEQTKRTEEYGFIISYSGAVIIEKTANGKTVLIKIETEKIHGGLGKYNNNALAIELNKMNEDGYEIVNVSASVTGNLTREIYLFKRKL